MKRLRINKSPVRYRSALFLAVLSLVIGFILAILTPGRTALREYFGDLLNNEITEGASTASESAVSREVESGYYQLSIDQLQLPQNVLSGLVIKGRIVQYLASIDTERFAVLVGSNSLPLGIQSASAIAIDPGSFGAALLIGSIEDGVVEFQAEVVNLTDSIRSFSQVRDLEYLGDGQFLVSNVDSSENCFALELWRFNLDFETMAVTQEVRMYRSDPCINDAIQVAETGGRIVTLNGRKDQVLLSAGSFGITTAFDLFGETYKQRPSLLTPPNHYGSTVLVAVDGTAANFTSGHRNIQGMFQDSNSGEIWATEQGPRGGDELNLLVQGRDYGWPDESIGTSYLGPRPIDQFEQDPWASRHSRFTRPVYSWIPSVAPSQLVKYEGDEFSLWNGDLIVTTLRDESLRRLRIESNTVLVDERIEIGRRVRDIMLLEDGRILLSLDDGLIAVIGVANSND